MSKGTELEGRYLRGMMQWRPPKQPRLKRRVWPHRRNQACVDKYKLINKMFLHWQRSEVHRSNVIIHINKQTEGRDSLDKMPLVLLASHKHPFH